MLLLFLVLLVLFAVTVLCIVELNLVKINIYFNHGRSNVVLNAKKATFTTSRFQH